MTETDTIAVEASKNYKNTLDSSITECSVSQAYNHPKHARAVIELQNNLGLHARAAAEFVKLSSKYNSEIGIINGVNARELSDGVHDIVHIHGKDYLDGKSILALLRLAAEKGTKLEIAAEGEDCHKAIHELSDLAMNKKFYED